jgi:hypothetical protein
MVAKASVFSERAGVDESPARKVHMHMKEFLSSNKAR